MKVDILQGITTPIPDLKVTKAEDGEAAPGEAVFVSVLSQMTAASADAEQIEADGRPGEPEKKSEPASVPAASLVPSEYTAASALQQIILAAGIPAVYEPSEAPESGEAGDINTIRPKPAAAAPAGEVIECSPPAALEVTRLVPAPTAVPATPQEAATLVLPATDTAQTPARSVPEAEAAEDRPSRRSAPAPAVEAVATVESAPMPEQPAVIESPASAGSLTRNLQPAAIEAAVVDPVTQREQPPPSMMPAPDSTGGQYLRGSGPRRGFPRDPVPLPGTAVLFDPAKAETAGNIKSQPAAAEPADPAGDLPRPEFSAPRAPATQDRTETRAATVAARDVTISSAPARQAGAAIEAAAVDPVTHREQPPPSMMPAPDSTGGQYLRGSGPRRGFPRDPVPLPGTAVLFDPAKAETAGNIKSQPAAAEPADPAGDLPRPEFSAPRAPATQDRTETRAATVAARDVTISSAPAPDAPQALTDLSLKEPEQAESAPVSGFEMPAVAIKTTGLRREGTPQDLSREVARPPAPPPPIEAAPASIQRGDASDGRQSQSLHLDLAAPIAVAGVRQMLAGFNSRNSAGESRPARRRDTGLEQTAGRLQVGSESSDVRRVPLPTFMKPVYFVEARNDEGAFENLNSMPAETKPAGNETVRSKPAEHRETPGGSGEYVWPEMQAAQLLVLRGSAARSGASEPPTAGMLRSGQFGQAITSAPWAAGAQSAPLAAASDLGSLAALLAPKHAAPSQEPSFLGQLAERIQMQLRDGESIIRIQLKPNTLGRVEIRAQTSAAGVVATILIESASVKNYLESNLHILLQSFQDQGLKVDRISVVVQDGFLPQHPSSGNQDPRSGAGQNSESKSTGWSLGTLDPAEEELSMDTQTLAALRPNSTFHTVA
jgi:hypothetical protein